MSLILDGTNGVSDIDGTAATPAIRGTDANTGIFFPAADTIAFSEGGTEAMRINSSGGVQVLNCIGVGNATPSTSGAGITFPATASPSSDANTLDDYEEGTWTPTWVNIGTGTYSQQFGRYTKIGRLVTIECYLDISTIGSASGTATIASLPFGASTTVATAQMWTNNFASLGQNVVGIVSSGNQIDLFAVVASGAIIQLNMGNLANNTNVVFNFSYSI